MAKKGGITKKVSDGKKKAAVKVKRTQLPPDAYEEWIKRQVVKPAVAKPEVQVPSDSYEAWLCLQVRKNLESRK